MPNLLKKALYKVKNGVPSPVKTVKSLAKAIEMGYPIYKASQDGKWVDVTVHVAKAISQSGGSAKFSDIMRTLGVVATPASFFVPQIAPVAAGTLLAGEIANLAGAGRTRKKSKSKKGGMFIDPRMTQRLPQPPYYIPDQQPLHFPRRPFPIPRKSKRGGSAKPSEVFKGISRVTMPLMMRNPYVAPLAMATGLAGEVTGMIGLGVQRIGSKRDVYNGKAMKTSGGLTKSDLMKNKRGKVVSIKQHRAGKRNNNLNL